MTELQGNPAPTGSPDPASPSPFAVVAAHGGLRVFGLPIAQIGDAPPHVLTAKQHAFLLEVVRAGGAWVPFARMAERSAELDATDNQTRLRRGLPRPIRDLVESGRRGFRARP
jgi:hypothetical protein